MRARENVLRRHDVETAGELIARVDRLPVWPHSRWVLFIIAVGWFFCFFDIQTIAFSLPLAIKHYHVSATIGATAASFGLIGFVVGELAISVISDRFGRRVGVFASIALYSVGALLNALAPGALSFIAARTLSGAGIGAYIGVAATYVSEVMPAPIRGRFAAWTTFAALVGASTTPFVALFLLPSVGVGWRILLALPFISVFPLILGARELPESIRWLIEHGRIDDAAEIVARMEDRVRRTLGSRELPPVEATIRAAVETEERETFTWTSIFRPPILRYTVIFFLVWFFNYVTVYGFGTMGVTLLVQHGYTLVHSIEMAIAMAIGHVSGGLISPFVSDRFSRKWPPFVVTGLTALELVFLGIFPGPVLITLYFFLVGFQVGIFAPLIYLLTAEHFPTSVRNLGVAFSDGVGHVGGAIAPIAATLVAVKFGFGAVFFFLSGAFWLCALTLLFAKPTTKRNLEAIILSEFEREGSARTAALPP